MAAIALTVTPPSPDFSLTLNPASLALTGGGSSGQVSVTATAVGGFTGPVAVAITGLPAGVTANPASLSLTPGAAQSVTLAATAPASAATAAVSFTGTSGSLSHSAALALMVLSGTLEVSTYHNDNSRDGLNAAEAILTPANVNANQFGRIGYDTVDGLVDAEPLYVANLNVKGALHNVLFVATEHDSVYAFDADTGQQLWMTSIIGSSETSSPPNGCTPEVGVTSTPVIDRKQGANGAIFVVGKTEDGNSEFHQRLHALDLSTGTEVNGSPTEISGSYPGTGDNSQNGNVIFDPAQYFERAALLLANGSVYLTWTSYCDQTPYTGWVMGYSEATLQQNQVLNLTPNGQRGAVWMSGGGMAADSSGNIYLLDANGTFDLGFDAAGFPTMSDYGNAILKLSTDSTGALYVSDFFEPYNTAAETDTDTEIGSGGTVLLPDLTDANGKTRQLLVAAGKDSHIYVADRTNLGKFNSVTSDNSNIYQDATGVLGNGAWSTPAYFHGSIYYAAAVDWLKAIPVVNAKIAATPSSQTSTGFLYPGATPSVSANGTKNGIVWILESSTTSPAVLHAYDATNLATELYNSSQAPNGRDAFTQNAANKFMTPMIANGKVYVATPNGVAVFGLLPQ